MTKPTNTVRKAKEVAYRAHDNQVDKAGEPYIEHVSRVAHMVRFWPEAEAVAWLHDVIEDRPEYEQELVEKFRGNIYWACALLNRNMSKTVEDYYSGIQSDILALVVKLADIQDNSDENRLSQLPDDTGARLREKYAKARRLLSVSGSTRD